MLAIILSPTASLSPVDISSHISPAIYAAQPTCIRIFLKGEATKRRYRSHSIDYFTRNRGFIVSDSVRRFVTVFYFKGLLPHLSL